MFYVVILVCANAVPASNCDEETARFYIRSTLIRQELYCGIQAQALIAGSTLKPEPDEYLKIACRRSKDSTPDRVTRQPI